MDISIQPWSAANPSKESPVPLIYFRLWIGSDEYRRGRFTDLKTLKGAMARAQRHYPEATEWEVSFTPFPGQEAL